MSQHRDRQPRILTAGYLTLDIVLRDLASLDYWDAVGGTCGNVSTIAVALGAEVTILARIGQDKRGERLLKRLRAVGVGTSGVEEVKNLHTPGIVELVRGGKQKEHLFSFICPSCYAQLTKAAVVSARHAKKAASQIQNFDAFFFDRATPATLHLAQAARGAGLLIVYEPTRTPRTETSTKAAALSDIVKMARRPGSSLEGWLPSPGASTGFLVETLGDQGVRFRWRGPRGWRKWISLTPIHLDDIQDAAGAGDWLTAGLLMECLRSKRELNPETVQQGLGYGQSLSAISIGFDGPQGALLALEQTTIGAGGKGDHDQPRRSFLETNNGRSPRTCSNRSLLALSFSLSG